MLKSLPCTVLVVVVIVVHNSSWSQRLRLVQLQPKVRNEAANYLLVYFRLFPVIFYFSFFTFFILSFHLDLYFSIFLPHFCSAISPEFSLLKCPLWHDKLGRFKKLFLRFTWSLNTWQIFLFVFFFPFLLLIPMITNELSHIVNFLVCYFFSLLHYYTSSSLDERSN